MVIACLPTVAFTCGNHLPVVVNTLDRPIRVRSTWEDGRSRDDSIGPSVGLFLSSPPHHPVEVMITPPDGDSLVTTRDDAPELLGSPVRGPVVGWKVTPAGIQPLGREELRSRDRLLPPGYALRTAVAVARRDDGRDGRLELLEDERLGHVTRAALAGDPLACDAEPPADALRALCAAIREEPLRPAVLRLVDAGDRERSVRALEHPFAGLAVEPLSDAGRPTYFVTVDFSSGVGSYSGPLTRLVEVDGRALRWLVATDVSSGRTVDVALPSSLKSAWRTVPRPDGRGRDILAVRCRPDFDAPTPGDTQFVVTFLRYSFADRSWRLYQRSEPGFWEAEDDSFPARERFP